MTLSEMWVSLTCGRLLTGYPTETSVGGLSAVSGSGHNLNLLFILHLYENVGYGGIVLVLEKNVTHFKNLSALACASTESISC